MSDKLENNLSENKWFHRKFIVEFPYVLVKDSLNEKISLPKYPDKYKLLFTVESVNELVNNGMPFRDAYIKVGKDVEAGNYQKPSSINHTHEGSIGNLCNNEIEKMMEKAIASGIRAKATTIPARTSPRILENHCSRIVDNMKIAYFFKF